MKKIISTIFYFSLLILPLAGQTETVVSEGALEAENINISIDSSLNGYVTAQECSRCPKIKLKIDKTTQAIKGGKVIHLHRANLLNGKYATILYNPHKKLVTQIIW